MPPQKKKGAKIQIKNQQKIAKAEDQIPSTGYQTQKEDIENTGQEQIKYDNPIEDDIQNTIASQSSPQKPQTQLDTNNNIKGRKRQAPKLTQQEVIAEEAPLRQQPARTRRQLAIQTNFTQAPKKIDRKSDDTMTSNENQKANASQTNTRGSKKKENSDQKGKKNQQKIVIESQEDDIEEDIIEEGQIKPEDLPLRQTKKGQQPEPPQQSQAKQQNTRNVSNQNVNNQQQQQNQMKKVQQNQIPIQIQNNNKSATPQTKLPISQNEVKPSEANLKNNATPSVAINIDNSNQSSGDKPNSGEKKKLTLREMEGLSKLLSIQVDGLKMKEQQMQSMLQNQTINTNPINNNGVSGSNYRPNQSNLQAQNNAQAVQVNGPNPNYSIKNLLNGNLTRNMVKPNNHFVQKQAIIYKNLNNLRSQLNDNHIVIDDEYQDDIENQTFDIDSKDVDIENLNVINTAPQPNYAIQQKIQHRNQVDQRIPLRSITPQSKTSFNQNINSMNQRPQQYIQQQQHQNTYGYQQNNIHQRKSVTPTGKMGIPQQNQQNLGKVTPIGLKGGKITPIMQKPLNQQMHLHLAQQQAMNNNLNGGKRTPITYGNQQQQNQQSTLIEIDNEIQSRLEMIRQNIGPLLACLSSDLMGGNNQQQQQQQTQQDINQESSYLNKRIYQDMRERRINQFDNQQQPKQVQIQPQQQLQQQQMRGRSLTPTIQTNRRHFDVDNNQIKNNNCYVPNNGQNVSRKITPIRGIQQQQLQQVQKQDHQQIPVGRNYDARAGDWLCGNCKNFNFAYRNICNRCGQLQDDKIDMVHPQITVEALNLIHELNHQGKKKTPIRTVDDVKRSFQDFSQNKENLKNISNTNGIQNQQFQQSKIQNKSPYSGLQQDNKLQMNPRNNQRLTYKQLEEYEQQLANQKQNQESKLVTNDLSNKNQNKEITTKNDVIGNQIIFIDNSSAQPLIESEKDAKNQSGDLKENQNNSGNQNNKQSKEQIQQNNQRKRAVDPRIQMR